MPDTPPLPALVIFDFDGVLVDSEVISLSELQAAMRDFGVDLPLETVRQNFLGSAINKIEAFMGTHGADTTGFAKRWYGTLFARFREELRLSPGVPALLDMLDARGIPYCIASGGSFERLGVAMEAVGLRRRFEGRVYSADLVKHGKPAPDLFELAAREQGAAPEACLVIEDSPAGIIAARSAGMTALGYVGGTHLDGCRPEHTRLLQENGAIGILDRLDWPALQAQTAA